MCGSESSFKLKNGSGGGILALEYLTGVGRKVVDEQTGEVARKVARGYSGESCIIDPRGEIIAGPAEDEQIFAAKAYCDMTGHYSRPDVFQLHVNRGEHRFRLDNAELTTK